MIPMRDGVKLHAKIFAPRGAHGPLPILIQRTPYGVAESGKRLDGSLKAFADDGYVFVFEDLRGKFGSEGVFVMQRPARPPGDTKSPRRGHRHLRHDRLAPRERSRQQRPRRHARRVLRRLDDDHGRARAAPGAQGDLPPGLALGHVARRRLPPQRRIPAELRVRVRLLARERQEPGALRLRPLRHLRVVPGAGPAVERQRRSSSTARSRPGTTSSRTPTTTRSGRSRP